MSFILKFQYADKNPDELETIGEVSLDEAINHFYEFDWKGQREINEERESANLSSSLTTYFLFNKNYENEFLSIYEANTDEYTIYYQNGSKVGEDFISNDLTKNPNGNTIEDILGAFFDGSLYTEKNIETESGRETDSKINLEDNIGQFNLKRNLPTLWWLAVPIVLVIITMVFGDVNLNREKFVLWLVFCYSAIILIHIPYLIILLQYLSKPHVLSLKYTRETNSLTLFFQTSLVTINKNEILQVVFTEPKRAEKMYTKLSSFKNMVLSLKNGQQYFLTNLTFSEDEFYFILEALKVHYYHLEKMYPVLVKKLFTKAEKRTHTNFVDKEQLEEKFSDYTEDQLKNITENPNDYQPVAVEVAKHLLKFRTYNKTH